MPPGRWRKSTAFTPCAWQPAESRFQHRAGIYCARAQGWPWPGGFPMRGVRCTEGCSFVCHRSLPQREKRSLIDCVLLAQGLERGFGIGPVFPRWSVSALPRGDG